MDVVVRLSVRRDLAIRMPHYDIPRRAPTASTRSYHVCTGIGPDLLEASRDAVREMITYLGDRHELDREEAYGLASVACDLRIHELVDAPNWVVGAFLPNDIFIRTDG